MHIKMLFILKRIICLSVIILTFQNVMSQNYMGLKIQDVKLIKGNNFTETKDVSSSYSTIVYEKTNNKIIKDYKTLESFGFDNNDIVIRYFRFDVVEGDEIVKIVKTNNQEYKRVDAGNKQNFFQWIDPEHGYNFVLNIIPIENVFVISYEISKE